MSSRLSAAASMPALPRTLSYATGNHMLQAPPHLYAAASQLTTQVCRRLAMRRYRSRLKVKSQEAADRTEQLAAENGELRDLVSALRQQMSLQLQQQQQLPRTCSSSPDTVRTAGPATASASCALPLA